ncbi:cyclodeaminase [Granulosicoccus antarcticus]|nr:cyclodeaminase [Granulosicoccus antarcticus]
MPDMKILTEQQLRTALPFDDDAVNCIEEAFRLLATREVVMPPILSFHVPEHNGEVDVKTAYVPGIDSFAIKMSPGFFDNPKLGLPSLNGLMVLFDARTGLVNAILLDNGYLTDVRTAAAGAVAARQLSRADSTVAGILGSGAQARLQLEALTRVRHIKSALIWGRDPEKAEACAHDCRARLGIEVSTGSIDEVMEKADIVVSTTPSRTPLISASMLRPGQHVTAMGSDANYKTELETDVIPAATLFVCDRLEQSILQGELRPALAAGSIPEPASYAELGEIVAGLKPGRESPHDITVCDLTGTGVQDTAIATLAWDRASKTDAGVIIHN